MITGSSSTPMACERRTPKNGAINPKLVEMARMNNPRTPVNMNTITMIEIMIPVTIFLYGNLLNTFANHFAITSVKKNPRIAAIRPARTRYISISGIAVPLQCSTDISWFTTMAAPDLGRRIKNNAISTKNAFALRFSLGIKN